MNYCHHRVGTEECTLYSEEVGAQACWALGLHNTTANRGSSPLFPLTGSSFMRLVVKKTDPSLSSYQIRYNLVKSEVNLKLKMSNYLIIRDIIIRVTHLAS